MLKPRSRLVALLAVLCVVIAPASIHAASTAPAGGGIAVSPGELTFTLGADSTSQSVPLTISNGYSVPVSISAAFQGIDETAELLIPVDNLDPTFASALSISQTDITLAAHSSQVLDVQVTNVASLSAGGHYATLVLTQQDLKGHPLSIKGAVSLTIFVVKNPGAVQSINLTGVTTNHWLFRLPTKATLGFNNDGNVLIVPRATVLVLDHSGHSALQKGVANVASHPLLPGKQLQSTVKVGSIAHTWLPQKVQLEVAYRADGASQLSTATASFWYIPPIYLLLLAPLGWPVWRRVNTRRRLRGRPLPSSITRVPPQAMMRKIQATAKQTLGNDHRATNVAGNTLAKAAKKLQTLQKQIKTKLRASQPPKQSGPKRTTAKRPKPRK